MSEHRDVVVRDTRTDPARQAVRRGAPMCHRAKYTLNLRGELTNKPGRKRNQIKCQDLTGSIAPNGPHRHE
jgi:hypothetical protein